METGSDVHQVDQFGNTLFVLAAQQGHDKCVETLLQAGADVNLGNKIKMEAARCGHILCIENLVRAGADGDKKDMYDCTALVWPARKGHDKCIDLLIQAGADVNIQGDWCMNTEYYRIFTEYYFYYLSRLKRYYCKYVLLQKIFGPIFLNPEPKLFFPNSIDCIFFHTCCR